VYAQRVYIVLAVDIVIGLVLGLVLSVTLGPPAAPGRESAQTGESRTSVDAGSRPEPGSRTDPNVVMLDGERAERLSVAPVRLREFRDERTAVGRIAFNDERTTSIFARFLVSFALHQWFMTLMLAAPLTAAGIAAFRQSRAWERSSGRPESR
jgi:hypothetical protein